MSIDSVSEHLGKDEGKGTSPSGLTPRIQRFGWTLPLLSGLFTFVLGAYLYCVTGLESAHFHLRRPPPTADLHSIPRLADDVLSRLIWWAGAIGLAFTMIVATVVILVVGIRLLSEIQIGLRTPLRKPLHAHRRVHIIRCSYTAVSDSARRT